MCNVRSLATIAVLLSGTLLIPRAFGQFSGSIEGKITDPAGALIAHAGVTLTNAATTVATTTHTDQSGNYTFASLAPGDYLIVFVAQGFAKTQLSVRLTTGQTLNVPLQMAVASQNTNVVVTGQAPVLDTADSRNELTVGGQSLQSLPLAGRNMISMVTLAPGVTGLGTVAGITPGSAVDNYSNETQVDASANGRSGVGNLFIIDGLDITSDIRPGVLNVTPNPDTIQETSIQTNTFTVDYGRASAIQMIMTTKSGTDQIHGNASEFYFNQDLWAGTEFTRNYLPFHSNNLSGTIGGPILPHHQLFGFFSIEPLRSTASSASTVSYEDPAFISWAETNYPNTLGTKILSSYEVHGVTANGSPILGSAAFPDTCGTSATNNLPCSLAIFDVGSYLSSSYRNGLQYNIRVDKSWTNDRLYGNFFRTSAYTSGPNPRPAFLSTSSYITQSGQVNETHTFSAKMLNEGAFGLTHGYGIGPGTGLFDVPVISVTGESASYGDGFALGNYYQYNYHWRDVLTRISGSHQFKVGYEGWHGDCPFDGQDVYEQPSFTFTNILNLVTDNPYTESGLSYSPTTGQPFPGFTFDYLGTTGGGFAEDTWKVTKNLTLNYGIRYDSFGNSYGTDGTVATNFVFGSGTTLNQQIASGSIVKQKAVLASSINNEWSPRAGFAYGIGNNWVLRGGAGVYHDWPSLGEVSEAVGLYSSPWGYEIPTFYSTGTSTSKPIFALGTSNSPPFGFPYPAIGTTTIDSRGGLVGTEIGIGGIGEHLRAPTTYNGAFTVERSLSRELTGSVGYVVSHSSGLITGVAYANLVNAVATGVDINRFAGDLLQNNDVLTRLNPSFGTINYETNQAIANYNGLVVALNGRFSKRGFITASYMRSKASDDDNHYATWSDLHPYYGPSSTDAPNRFTLGWNYELPGIGNAATAAGHLINGWSLSGVTTLQSGYPFTVYTSAPFIPEVDSSGNIVHDSNGSVVPASNSGDYNADGYDYDFPNVAKYNQPTSRKAYLNGLFPASNFTAPTPGTEGNESVDRYREPGYADTDLTLKKSTHIAERLNFDLRVDFFDVFNRPNLSGFVSDLSSPQFATATSQYNPRWMQIGGNLTF